MMILADTSIWVEHLRTSASVLSARLNQGEILCHPCIIGELALGSLRQRKTILTLLSELPRAVTATDEEVTRYIEQNKLYARGIGWVDAHLIVSALLTNCALWTKDAPLKKIAAAIGIEYR